MLLIRYDLGYTSKRLLRQQLPCIHCNLSNVISKLCLFISTSWSRLICWDWNIIRRTIDNYTGLLKCCLKASTWSTGDVLKTRLEDVFKAPSGCLQNVFSTATQNLVLKTSSSSVYCIGNVMGFWTSSRRL